MIHLTRTDSKNADFIELVKLLDAELAERDGKEHAFYAPFNKIDMLKYVVMAYDDEKPVSCGAMKEIEPGVVEIKRMYTGVNYRGKGFASQILAALEDWACELGYKTCVLETGTRQPEAIRLYEKNGYARMANYAQYKGVENSLCFEKNLIVRT